jgi:hypothetical protein
MHRFAISIALLSSLFLLPACGSSADGTASSGPAKAQFIKRADQTCERTDKIQNAAIATVLKRRSGASQSTALEEKAVIVAGLPPIRVEMKELDALRVPDGDEEQIEAFLDAVTVAIEKAEEDPSTLLDSNSLGPFAEASKLAKKYGFKACAFPL